MKKLDNLLPFLTILIVFGMLLIMSSHSFGAVVNPDTNNKICAFKLNTARAGSLKKILPSGMYRIVGEKSGAQYSYAFFQKRVIIGKKPYWRNVGSTHGGNQVAVELRKMNHTYILYFDQNKSRPGSCTLEGSMHGWSS